MSPSRSYFETGRALTSLVDGRMGLRSAGLEGIEEAEEGGGFAWEEFPEGDKLRS